MGSYTSNPDYGRRLLHVTIDEIAREEPSRPWCSLPASDADLSKGWVDYSFKQFADGINRLCWLIEKSFGLSENKFPTICYLGASDVRYHFVQMAAAKTGYQVLFSSHMHSREAHLRLMETTNTIGLLSASGVAVDDILRERSMPHSLVPELDDLFDSPAAKHYPYTKTFDQAKNDPYLILHSSGTTGHPKPLPWNHGAGAAVDAAKLLPTFDQSTGRTRKCIFHPGRQRVFGPTFPFHGISALPMMVATVFGGGCFLPGLRQGSVNTEQARDVFLYSGATMAMLTPALAEDLSRKPDAAAIFGSLNYMLMGGATCNQQTAEIICKYTDLINVYGTTENMNVPQYLPDKKDFEYNTFDIKHTGADFRPLGDGTHRLYFVKTPESERFTAIFRRIPGMTEYDTGDVWLPHPDPKKSAFAWKFVGRADDLITYKDGNNFLPITYEAKHTEHPLIRSAVMSGMGHRQPVLTLEPYDFTLTATPEAQKALLEQIWAESIVKVNDSAPKNGQIAKTHVVFSTTEKSFARTPKNNVARKKTIEAFKDEIEDCYRFGGDESMDVTERWTGEN